MRVRIFKRVLHSRKIYFEGIAMKALVLGAGMIGRAIAYDLCRFSNFDNITIVDKDRKTLRSAEKFLDRKSINFDILDVTKIKDAEKYFEKFDLVISALPYYFNYNLSKLAIKTKTHFLDLGGNNDVVKKQRDLFDAAKKAGVIIMPDCGLAPGLVSIITKDIVEKLDTVDYVKLRVGGLPQDPKPPLNYQIVFSPNGLINEYVEDAIVLESGKITKRKTMEEIEKINFPEPFGEMEAFITSGGCSILPYTYKNKIGYLDYKTIRYPGHCEKFKSLLEIGLGQEKEMKVKNQKVSPRDVLIALLEKNLPAKGKDLVLLKVFSRGKKNGRKENIEYTLIDYFDEKNQITSMMRTTGYPISIIAQMIERGIIKKHGVFCNEEIIPCKEFFCELEKRNIKIERKIK